MPSNQKKKTSREQQIERIRKKTQKAAKANKKKKAKQRKKPIQKKMQRTQTEREQRSEQRKETTFKQLCDNCGAEVGSSNICMRCGAFYNPIQKALAERLFQDQQVNSGWLTEAPSFKGMGTPEIQYTEGLKCLEKMKLNEALQYYDREVQKNPNDEKIWNNFGVAFMGMKNRKDALGCYAKAIKINPNYYIGLYNIGAVHYECEQYEEAIKYFDKTIEVNPKCGEAHWDKHLAREKLGHMDLGWTFKAMEKGINTMRARMNQSSALVDLGNGNDAVLGHYKLSLKNNHQLLKLHEEAINYAQNGNTNQALQVIDNCIRINPDDPTAWGMKGTLFLQSQNFDKALPCFENALRVDSHSVRNWLALGTVHVMKKNVNEALHCYNNALRINPFDQHVKQGKEVLLRDKYKTLRQQGNNLEAIKILDEILNEGLQSAANIWVEKGTIYADMKQIDKAVECFNIALKEDPKNVFAWLNKGGINLQQEKYLYAYECYSEALKINPNEQRALEGRSFALAKSREKSSYESELEQLKKSLYSHPKEAIDWMNKGMQKTQTRDLEEALTCFEKALEIDSNFPEVWIHKANTYIILQNYEMAIRCFDEIIKEQPESTMMMIDVWLNKGVCHRKINELDKALESYTEASKIAPNMGDIWANMANIYLDLKQPEISLRFCDKAIEVGSDQSGHNTIAKNSKGTALYELERYQEALKMYEDVLEFNPAFAPSLVGKGVSLHKLGKLRESIPYFDRAIKAEPTFTVAWYQKANVLYDLQEFKDALVCYNEILRIDTEYIKPDDRIKFEALKTMNFKEEVEFRPTEIKDDSQALKNKELIESFVKKNDIKKPPIPKRRTESAVDDIEALVETQSKIMKCPVCGNLILDQKKCKMCGHTVLFF